MQGNVKPGKLCGFLGQLAGAQFLSWAIDSVLAEHVVGEVFDLRHNTLASLPLAALDNYLGFHGQPPFAPHLVRRQNEEEKFTNEPIFRQIDLPGPAWSGGGYSLG